MKAFGFPIHGTVDGFSRKVLWLAVVKLNNNSVIPATLYLRSAKEHDACTILSENRLWILKCRHGWIAMVLNQKFLLTRLGPSHANQLIENCWSHFWRLVSGCAIDHFKELVHTGKFISNNMFHMEFIWFVYIGWYIQKTLFPFRVSTIYFPCCYKKEVLAILQLFILVEHLWTGLSCWPIRC